MSADLDKLRLRAKALIEKRKQEGTWQGSVRPHVEYQKRPLEWIVKHLGVPEETLRWSINQNYGTHEWDGTPDPLIKILETLADGRDCGVESGTGTGKTFLAACIVYWFLACFENAIVVTAAPREDQVLKHSWKEIGRLWPKFERHFPQASLGADMMRMLPAVGEKEVWAASAFVCGVGASEEVATRAAGLHARHLLIITEETPGIHTAIMEAFYNTRSDDHNLHLALGNPDHRLDALHQFCVLDEVEHIRISALDHPNVVTGETIVPGAIGRRRLDERINRYGKDSRLYQSRVRGISPKEAQNALIRWEWCEAAAARYNDDKLRNGSHALGVDVANSRAGDKGSIARWLGACLTEVESFPCPDASHLGVRVFNEAKQQHIDPRHIGIDSVGVGSSTVNKLKELGMRVRHIGGGNKAIPGVDVDTLWSETEPDLEGNIKSAGPVVVGAERFDNLRSQVWWQMREDLRLGRVALPYDEDLWLDLCTPKFETDGGKIVVESKKSLRKNLGRSPDKGDAAVYGNFVRSRVPIERQEPRSAAKLPRRDANREYGLEKLMYERRKRQKKQSRQMRRLLSQIKG